MAALTMRLGTLAPQGKAKGCARDFGKTNRRSMTEKKAYYCSIRPA